MEIRPKLRPLLVPLSWVLVACAAAPPDRPGFDRDMGGYPQATREEPTGARGDRAGSESGVISYYGDKFHGRKTASGEIFDKHAYTAAHRSLPFRTKVRVTNLDNGKSVVVVINDRGPFVKGRILDLSQAAARDIGLIGRGTARARITVQ